MTDKCIIQIIFIDTNNLLRYKDFFIFCTSFLFMVKNHKVPVLYKELNTETY